MILPSLIRLITDLLAVPAFLPRIAQKKTLESVMTFIGKMPDTAECVVEIFDCNLIFLCKGVKVTV